MIHLQPADMSVIQSVDRSVQEVILTTCLLCLQMDLYWVQVAEPLPVLSAKSLLSLRASGRWFCLYVFTLS